MLRFRRLAKLDVSGLVDSIPRVQLATPAMPKLSVGMNTQLALVSPQANEYEVPLFTGETGRLSLNVGMQQTFNSLVIAAMVFGGVLVWLKLSKGKEKET